MRRNPFFKSVFRIITAWKSCTDTELGERVYKTSQKYLDNLGQREGNELKNNYVKNMFNRNDGNTEFSKIKQTVMFSANAIKSDEDYWYFL